MALFMKNHASLMANQVADLPGQLHTYRPRSNDPHFLKVLPHTRYRRHGLGPAEGFVKIYCRLIRDWNIIDFNFLSQSINSQPGQAGKMS